MLAMKTIKQTNLAKMASISDGFLSQIISGVRRPSWRTAKKLAIATDTKPELWLEGDSKQIKETINHLAS
jgi:transcriptional regulator with XRE-family HTH domain